MKRYMLVLVLCFCLVIGGAWFGKNSGEAAEQAFAAAEAGGFQLVLDAGHGGEDGGALSAAGDKESNVNLSIVLRMDQLLGLCGVLPILTRSEDVSIHDAGASTLREKKVSDIHNRVALVESQPSPLLVSIHQNSYPDARYSGAQVFYGRTEESRIWGEAAQEILRQCLDENNSRAAKRIPDTVYLMNHISCPAILVECGFMSNREEAARLQTPEYQKKLAAALTGACLQYIHSDT